MDRFLKPFSEDVDASSPSFELRLPQLKLPPLLEVVDSDELVGDVIFPRINRGGLLRDDWRSCLCQLGHPERVSL